MYASGTGQNNDGAAWTNRSGDLAFRVFVTLNTAAVTMPAGYTRRALIRYVYNTATGAFREFAAQDRFVTPYRPDSTAPSSVADLPVLHDIGAQIPPGLIRLRVSFAASVDQASMMAAPVPAGYGFGYFRCLTRSAMLGAQVAKRATVALRRAQRHTPDLS